MNKSLRSAVFLVWAASGLSCGRAPESRSAAAEAQLYQVVVDAALGEAQVEGAVPQIQVQTVRADSHGVAAPGDRPEHYTPETAPGLLRAAEALSGVTLRYSAAEFDPTQPAEIFTFSDPAFFGDTLVEVSVKSARFHLDMYFGEGWKATLRWEDGEWTLAEWRWNIHETGG